MWLPEMEEKLVRGASSTKGDQTAGGANVKHAILTNTITQQLPVSCNRPVCPESVCGAQAKRKSAG
jgi:hypothetical protein